MPKGRRARAEKNVRCTSTRKKTERKTENRWKDSCKRDMKSVMLKEEEEALEGTKWKNDIHNHSGDLRWWEKPKDKKKDNPVPMWAHMQQFRVWELFS